MKNLSLIFFFLFCSSISAQRVSINFSLDETNEENKLNKYLEYESLCNKLNFVEKNVSEFVSLDSRYRNLDKILENISEKSKYEIQILIAYGKKFTTFEQRKEKLIEDVSTIKQNFKCLESNFH
ncbi:hypothetical protein [Chryseobacterium geocarposphaerae]|uniref:Uncharacterized protein n=1 Tax=Chryseobacterium geocarposphaerae TaxID=1416776 RepID=A0A2M9C736_9FLAO|nr:hypothetical protein [Chryseobacterium geocarposphaerae]PJJ66639.1 hypothetical protein CLV73_0628 [Chryseobacterium geocarposphaerae]